MNNEQLLALIGRGVSSELAFLRADSSDDAIAREIVAMANFRGGKILIGVEKTGEITGIGNSDIENRVKDIIDRMVRPGISPDLTIIASGTTGFVFLLTIPQGTNHPCVLYQKPGDDKLAARIPQRVVDAGTFAGSADTLYPDSLPINGSNLESLDQKKLLFYFQHILKDPELPRTRTEWEKKLKAAGLMINEGFSPRCPAAAVLLFAKEPWKFFRGRLGLNIIAGNAKEGMGRGGGFSNQYLSKFIDAPFLGNPTILGSAFWPQKDGQIEECLSLIEPFIRKNKQNKYSPDALKEILVNAFVHRDWFVDFETEVDVYTDRIEVSSSGTAPAGMNVEKMLAGQRQCKNPTVMKILREYGYASYCGRGLSGVVIPELSRYGIQPSFSQSETSFRVTLPCI